jgi:hypothetical protein
MKRSQDLKGRICRAIIRNNDLVIRVQLLQYGRDLLLDISFTIKGGHANANHDAKVIKNREMEVRFLKYNNKLLLFSFY